MLAPPIDAPFADKIVGGWSLQIAGHQLFEKNMPSTHKGWITYQLTGVIYVLEAYGEMLARRGQRKVSRSAPSPPIDTSPPKRTATMAA